MENSLSRPATETWWSRNWKWFVPLATFALLVFFVAFVGVILLAVFGVMKSSDVYQQALVEVRSSPAALTALGTPVAEGWFCMGSIKINGPSGEAKLSIPVYGSKGEGTVYLEAIKSVGVWTFSALVLELDDSGHRIDLLQH